MTFAVTLATVMVVGKNSRNVQPGDRGGACRSPSSPGRSSPSPMRPRLGRAAAPLRRHTQTRTRNASGPTCRRNRHRRAAAHARLDVVVAASSAACSAAMWRLPPSSSIRPSGSRSSSPCWSCAINLADEFIGGTLRGQSRIATTPAGEHGPAPPLARADRRSGERRRAGRA